MAEQRLMLIMAHPDDAEFSAGGLMTLWHQAGSAIKILCLTNGNAGHHKLDRAALAARRHDEARQAAALVNAEIEIWPQDDGRLVPSVELREQLIAAIRAYTPSVIVIHRTADYHPDHRATAQLVKDSAYLLQVPAIAPEQSPMMSLPSILLTFDRFDEPRPFRLDWVIDTAAVQPQIIDLLACHASQVFEWLPSLISDADDDDGPFDTAWLTRFYQRKPAAVAKKARALNPAHSELRFAEAFEVSDYGSPFDNAHFDFLPGR
jgi:LmbE family N-acetylglucosaminyl deacetylase